MHRCLEIQEILALICSEISDTSQLMPQSQASLAALAQTSRNFKETALDALWRHQTSLIPLIRCFPEDSWEFGVQGNVKSLRFTRPLDLPDWGRVLFYARRIKILRYMTPHPLPRRTQEYAPLAVWQVLAVCQPPSLVHLTPNLRELLWKESDTCFPYIRLLLAPTIARLELPLQGSEVLRLSFLSTVNALYPSLVHVKLSYSMTKQMTPAVSHAICQWRSIKSLEIRTLTAHALSHLAQMPSLEYLVCADIPADYIPRPRTFLVLRHLNIISTRIPSLTSFLTAISSEPHLESIETSILPQSSPNFTWEEILILLVPFRATLTKVDLTEGVIFSGGNTLDVLVPEVLRLLLTIPNLVHLTIRPRRLCVNNQLLHEMAVAWPKLRHLDLNPLPISQSFDLTLRGALSLAAGCPELVYLGLPLDISTIESCHAVETSNASLKTLSIQYTSKGDPAKVVAFLIGMFPNLRSFGEEPVHRELECALQALRALRRRAPIYLG